MSFEEYVIKFLEKNYNVALSQNDYSIKAFGEKSLDASSFISHVSAIIGGGVKEKNLEIPKIAAAWLSSKGPILREKLITVIRPLDVTKGSEYLLRELVNNPFGASYDFATMSGTVTNYYLSVYLDAKLKELFDGFRLELGYRNWEVFWCDRIIIDSRHFINMFFNNESIEVTKYITEYYNKWYQIAVETYTEIFMNKSF